VWGNLGREREKKEEEKPEERGKERRGGERRRERDIYLK